MINFLKNLLEPDPMKLFLRGDGRVYSIGGGWGNRIEWFGNMPDQQRVCGWKCRRPNSGDWLECQMKSGKRGLYRFVSVEYCSDPDDMFFADVEPVGYVDDNDFAERSNRYYQKSKFACDHNAKALEYLELALEQLDARTRDREKRLVEGTHVK